MSLQTAYGIASGVIVLLVIAGGVYGAIRDRLRIGPDQLNSERNETTERHDPILRPSRLWVSALVILLGLVLVLLHLRHAVYIALVLLLAGVVWPVRLRTWWDARRRRY